jgi:molybdopterin molybdotransferase
VIPPAEALARILATTTPLTAISLPVENAAGFFAAADILSSAALPRFDQSAMDGYALRAADTPGSLRIVGEQPAGAARALRVGNGEAVRIFTGAPLPDGADAVVMQEDVTAADGVLHVGEAIAAGEFLRRRGEDVCEGQRLVAAGESLTAARIGLLAAVGLGAVEVHRRARVAIVTTGDELRPPGAPLAPGELHDSNGPQLAAQLASAAEIASVGHCGDDSAALAEMLLSCADADALVLSAGVSVGGHDPVHDALRRLGAGVDFWRVAVKPGKPFLLARLGDRPVFGLPGNPVSTFVTAQLFVLPALRRMAGAAQPVPAPVPVVLGAAVENPGDRTLYLRATRRDGRVLPAPLQQSHGLASLAASDFLIPVAPGASHRAGETLDAISLI